MSIDINDPEIQAELKALVEQQTATALAGIKAKNEELISEKRKLQEEWAEFKDLDKNMLKNYIERLKTDEEAKLIAEGKIAEVIDRRTERMREAYSNQIEEKANAAKDWQNKFSDLERKFNFTRIDSAIRDAALATNVVSSAIDDVITRGRGIFEIDENGRLISKDPNTNDVRIGADGKSPYNPNDFIMDLKKTAPHFWPQSQSGGFSGGSPADRMTHMQSVLTKDGGFEEYRKLRNTSSSKK